MGLFNLLKRKIKNQPFSVERQVTVEQKTDNMSRYIMTWMEANPELKLISDERKADGYTKTYQYRIGYHIEIELTDILGAYAHYDTKCKIWIDQHILFLGEIYSISLHASTNSIGFGYWANEIDLLMYRIGTGMLLLADLACSNGWMLEKAGYAHIVPYSDILVLVKALQSFGGYSVEHQFPSYDLIAILSKSEALRLFRRKIQFELRQDKNSSLLKYLVFSEVDPRIVEYILESVEQHDSTEADFIHRNELSFATELNLYFDVAYQHMPLTQTVLFGWKTSENDIILALSENFGFKLPFSIVKQFSSFKS